MTTFTTTQPALAGKTLYAVLARGGVTLATVAMAESPAGTFAGAVPLGITPGTVWATAYRQLGGEPDPATDWPIAGASLYVAGDGGGDADDLMAAVLATLASDAGLVAESGSDPAPVFEGTDARRSPADSYPYGVVVAVAGRSGSFTGRGDLMRDRYLDVHWLDEDAARAERMARRSAVALRGAAVAGDLDTAEGAVQALLPGPERALVDPRSASGIGDAVAVTDAMIQVRVVLSGSLS